MKAKLNFKGIVEMNYTKHYLKMHDKAVCEAIDLELKRQREKIELIASENFTSLAVMAAQGSVMTNKYAEGYPNKRYYGGCEYVDIVEDLARDRAKALFGAKYANVQAHSGANANFAVYFALLNPGDKVLGMNLSHGGHLTHGSPVNISGNYFDFADYGVDKETETINYEDFRQKALDFQPKLIVAGASAYPRAIDFEKMGAIAKECGALLMVDMAHIAGLVAAGLHQNPLPYADVVTSTTHKTLRGPRGGLILTNDEALAKKIDKAIFPGVQGGPLMHVIAAKAVAFGEALSDDFKVYMKQVVKNASVFAESLKEKGFRLVSGGTDNHLILVDVKSVGLTGKEAEAILDECNITCNKNTIPYDEQTPFITSGIRLGTPAVTTRGMNEEDMKTLAEIFKLVLIDKDYEEAKILVKGLTDKYPLYPDQD